MTKQQFKMINRQIPQATQARSESLRIIPLGGLGEVGRNMTLIEYEKKILIIDVGLRMPEEDMPGIDFIIPDTTYIEKRKNDVLGIVFTHGHYDHIGAFPYLIKKIFRKNLKIFASGLTKGIILKRQSDFLDQPKLNIQEVKDGSKIQLGALEIEFFKQNHSIPDNMGLIIKTPIGNILHTSDFKFDHNPVNESPTNFKKLKQIGERGILLMLSDSTGAEQEGHSLSEKEISENLEEIFKKSNGRIIAATFSSLLNRVQQLITLSEKYKRKVCVEGYSMKSNIKLSQSLGYIKARKETFIKTKNAKDYPDNRVTVLCTGAQGESEAALMRITNKEHRFLRIKGGDTLIFSSSVIPGNERTVQIMKDEILRQGAKVYHYKMMDIHAGGHAKKEELEKMLQIMRPKFFMPNHGQLSMLFAHAEIAKKLGMSPKNIIVGENGQVISLSANKIFIEKKRVPSNYVMVDGLGVGDVGEIVLRDRKMLADDGMFVIITVVNKQTGKIINSPDIISRGFVYLRESKNLLMETRKKTLAVIKKTTKSGGATNWTYVKNQLRNEIGRFLFTKTKRRPMVLPVIIEV